VDDKPSLTDEVRIAAEIMQQLQAAGIESDDPDLPQLLASESNIQGRIVNLLRVSRRTKEYAAALAKIIGEERERKERLDRKAERLRDVALWAMQETGLPKVEAPDLSASVSAGKPKVIIIDEQMLPDAMCRVERTANKTALAQALQHGPIPGAELANGTPTLTVRTR
jgi:Siphovirus Gp157